MLQATYYFVLQQTGYHCWSPFVQFLLSNCLCASGHLSSDNISALQNGTNLGELTTWAPRHGHRMFLSLIGCKVPGSHTSTYKSSIHGPSLPQTGEKRPRRMETTTVEWPSTPSLPGDLQTNHVLRIPPFAMHSLIIFSILTPKRCGCSLPSWRIQFRGGIRQRPAKKWKRMRGSPTRILPRMLLGTKETLNSTRSSTNTFTHGWTEEAVLLPLFHSKWLLEFSYQFHSHTIKRSFSRESKEVKGMWLWSERHVKGEDHWV